MKLDLQKIKSITFGAASVREANGEFVFDRFTEQQLQVYKEYRTDEMLKRALTSAGIRLTFETDSDSFAFSYTHNSDYSFGLAYIEVRVNDELAKFFTVDAGQVGVRAEVLLPEGKNKVDLYFPWQKSISLSDVTLDDGATVTPVKRSRVMINYGDSITHGVNAQLPSGSYAARIAKMLDADAYNKAVAGERFIPELLEPYEPIKPDIVTVAYGTNDWFRHSRETVIRRSRDFLSRVSEKFPTVKIFVISPIWRAMGENRPKFDGSVTEIHGIIEENCKDLKNMIIFNGMDLLPHDPTLYKDGLHPTDTGMEIYANALYEKIKKYI